MLAGSLVFDKMAEEHQVFDLLKHPVGARPEAVILLVLKQQSVGDAVVVVEGVRCQVTEAGRAGGHLDTDALRRVDGVVHLLDGAVVEVDAGDEHAVVEGLLSIADSVTDGSLQDAVKVGPHHRLGVAHAGELCNDKQLFLCCFWINDLVFVPRDHTQMLSCKKLSGLRQHGTAKAPTWRSI